jgi:hypothetical protein
MILAALAFGKCVQELGNQRIGIVAVHDFFSIKVCDLMIVFSSGNV